VAELAYLTWRRDVNLEAECLLHCHSPLHFDRTIPAFGNKSCKAGTADLVVFMQAAPIAVTLSSAILQLRAHPIYPFAQNEAKDFQPSYLIRPQCPEGTSAPRVDCTVPCQMFEPLEPATGTRYL
jgi:hypothetical protein